MADALALVQKMHPEVTKVIDGRKDVIVEVTKRDTAAAAVRSHKSCALAVACQKMLEQDGAVIARSVAYLIKGQVATRYLLPPSVSREIVSFDRGGGFAIGEYKLNAPRKHNKLGGRQHGDPRGANKPANGGWKKRYQHVTKDIRSLLLSKGE